MGVAIQTLLAMVRDFRQRVPLEEMLQGIVTRTANMLAAPRVSLRLFDASHTRLLAVCRAGEALHRNPMTEFRPGEGLVGWIAQRSAPIRTGDADHDPRFAARPDLKQPMGSYLGVPLLIERTCIGVLAASDSTANRFTPDDQELLELIAGICAPHIEIVRRLRLEQVDEMTGALNLRGLDLALPDLSLLAVIAVGVDRFARVNEAHGREAGDEALKRVARLLGSAIRAGDALVRLEEDRFLLVLPATTLSAAATIAEQARGRVGSSGIAAGGATLRFTLSAGVAVRRYDEPRDALLARAEAALAAAKRAGRNRVEVVD